MKPRRLIILSLIILFTILQCTLLNDLQILGVKPDSLLILVIFFSLKFGRIYGLAVGAICGLFAEATSALPLGSLVLTYALGGLVLGHIGRWVYSKKFLGQIYISFVFSFCIYLALFFILQGETIDLSPFTALIAVILPVSIYTAAAACVLLRFLTIVLPTR